MSPIHVGELTTEVESLGAPGVAEHTVERSPWEELERLRRALAEHAELRARTSAEGFDD